MGDPGGRACGAAHRLCPAAPASSMETWSRSRLFALQTWRRRGEARPPAPWACRNPGCSPRLDPQHIDPSPNLSPCQCKAVAPQGEVGRETEAQALLHLPLFWAGLPAVTAWAEDREQDSPLVADGEEQVGTQQGEASLGHRTGRWVPQLWATARQQGHELWGEDADDGGEHGGGVPTPLLPA